MKHELNTFEFCAGLHLAGRGGGEDARFLSPNAKKQYMPHRTFFPEHIRLDLHVDVKKKHAEGMCTTKLALIDTHAENITFDAVEMNVSKVEVNGKKVPFDYDKKTITISTKHIHAKSTVRITYSVTNPHLGIFFIHPTKDTPNKPYQAWTHSETSEARYWYPCQDQPESKCPIEMHLTVPQPFKAISNGNLVATKENTSNKTTTFSWEMKTPNAPYLNNFCIGDFTVVKDKWKHVSVDYYCEKGREEDIQRSFGNTPKMIEFFSHYVNYEYPHKKYAQIAVADFIYGGMEHTTSTTQTDAYLQDEIAHQEWGIIPEGLVAHELAHQWFGDLLTCKDWAHEWLNESFATFFDALWMEKSLGKDEYDYEMYSDMLAYFDEDKNRYRRPIVTNMYTQPEDIGDRHLYEKGAFILHGIRKNILGEDAFRKALSHYVNTHAHTAVQTEDLLTSIRLSTGKNLTQFFDQWIYGAGHLEGRVNVHYDSKSKKTIVRVLQTQAEPYTIPLTIAITHHTGKVTLEKRMLNAKEHQLSFATSSCPLNVVVDPENTILKNMNVVKPREMWVHQLKKDTNVVQRIYAAQELCKTFSHEEIDALSESLMKDPFFGVRGEVARALGTINLPQVKDVLLRAYASEKNNRVKRTILTSIGIFKTDDVRKFFLNETKRTDSYIIPSEAYRSLGMRKDPNELAILLEATTKESWYDIIAMGGMDGLGQQQSAEALKLLTSFTHVKYSNNLRQAAIRNIGICGKGRSRAMETLIELTKDYYINVQYAATKTLGDLGDWRAIPTLEKMMKEHGDNRIKRVALESIRKLNGGLDLPPYKEEGKGAKKEK